METCTDGTPPMKDAPATSPGGRADGTALHRFAAAAAVYGHPRLIAVFVLGFSSGLPLALSGATLGIWLARSGVDIKTIGLFALVGTAYSLKFLWAPLVDRMPLPGLTRRLGRRRSWLVAAHLAVMGVLLGLGASDPAVDVGKTALLAVCLAFCSATLDIVIDAWRVEILDERQYGAGAAMVVFGYRCGMLASGAGALYIAALADWSTAYTVMAALLTVGLATVLLVPEPERAATAETAAREVWLGEAVAGRVGMPGWIARGWSWLSGAVVAPFADFAARPGWIAILLFIVFYKFGDALAGWMANPFYVALGFTNIEIANITKLFGFGATLVGIFLGGMLVHRAGIMKSLLICGVLQLVSNLMFAVQAVVGHDTTMLAVTIGLENLSGGMGTAAFVAYLSSLCNVAYTATQYALLSSLMAVARTTLTAPGGWLAEAVGWAPFFVATAVAALPGLLLLIWMTRRWPAPAPAPNPGPTAGD